MTIANDAAIAQAYQIGLGNGKRIHHRDHVGFHQLVAVALRRAGAATVAAAVDANDVKAGVDQKRDDQAEVVGVSQSAMDHDERLAAGWHELRPPHLDVVDVHGARNGRWR